MSLEVVTLKAYARTDFARGSKNRTDQSRNLREAL